jgi:Ca2+-binding EF-hand superfamily protein
MKNLHYMTLALIGASFLTGPAMAFQKAPATKGQTAQTSNTTPGVSRVEDAKRGDAEFAQMDANKDGIVDEAEVAKFAQAVTQVRATAQNKAMFAKLDTDKNGAISAQEFLALLPKNIRVDARAMLTGLDGNKDGKITAAEFRASRAMQFAKMDSNNDGVISRDEVKAVRKAAPKK